MYTAPFQQNCPKFKRLHLYKTLERENVETWLETQKRANGAMSIGVSGYSLQLGGTKPTGAAALYVPAGYILERSSPRNALLPCLVENSFPGDWNRWYLWCLSVVLT